MKPKKTKIYLLVMILLITNCFSIILLNNQGMNVNAKTSLEQPKEISLNYVDHLPIVITDNTGLLSYSSSGTGIVSDPYVISGFNITTVNSYAIYIHGAGVTAYFTIKECYFNSSYYGVHIDGINEGIASIENNTFVDCDEVAIYVEYTNDVNIDGNYINNSSTAIFVEASEDFTIIENTIHNCGKGIYGNYYDGVFLDMNITANIYRNSISDIDTYSIIIYKYPSSASIVDSIVIAENIIDNSGYGISVLYSPNVNIEENILTNIINSAIDLNSGNINSDYQEYFVINNTITGGNYGISVYNHINNASIIQNEVTNTNRAFFANSPANLTVRDNSFIDSSLNAIELNSVTNASIMYNYISNGTVNIDLSSEVKIFGNTINGGEKSIDIFESESVTIYDNTLGNNEAGIGVYVYAVINLNITQNAFSELDIGIKLYADLARYLQNVSITDNSLENMDYGIYTSSGRILENCLIQGNNITNIFSGGIILKNGGTGLKIIDNFVASNIQAIEVSYNWNDIIISENTILVYSIDGSGRALEVKDTDGGEITNNSFYDFAEGSITTVYFVYLTADVTNMEIYYNQFFSKAALIDSNVYLAKDDGVTNTWYNALTETGNYWSNYNGIGAYSITGDANAEDLYPITNTDSDSDGLDDILENYLGTNPYSADSDSDKMPDLWELENGLNPLIDDADGDEDSDNLTNLEEYQNDCDPNDSDSDDDLMPDGWEVEYDLDPLVNDASEDADSDEIDNYTEYIDGTNPNNADSDGDSYTDKEEKDAGTDPLDPNSHPEEEPTDDTSFFYLFSILSLLAMVSVLHLKHKR